MMALRGLVATTLASLVLLLPACTVDRGANTQFGCDGCPEGQCMFGYCLVAQDDGSDDGNGDGDSNGDGDGDVNTGGDGDAGGGDPGACDQPPDMPGFCFEGAEQQQALEGRCRAGSRLCIDGSWGPCLGQVLPTEESCNGDDDDCDSRTDEDLTLGSCDTMLDGVCGQGVVSCEGGVQFCVSATAASAEICDNADNDCDGSVDEDTDGPCYPDGLEGCTALPEGGFDCDGICAAGMQRCRDGELEACEDFVGPETEQCNTGQIAADENCNGQTDETCTCTGNQEQECYSGPDGTQGRGICKPGRQVCQGGFYGECTGQTMPGVESCLNEGADDNCDGTRDNIPGRDQPCTLPAGEGGPGVCRDGRMGCDPGGEGAALVCVPRQPTPEVCNGIDDDCSDGIDEDFQDDPEQCGSSCAPCGTAQACCAGQCTTIRNNDDACGSCTNDCGTGLNCCGTQCVDRTSNPMHCGECGNVCPILDLTGQRCCLKSRCVQDDATGADECRTTLPPLFGGGL